MLYQEKSSNPAPQAWTTPLSSSIFLFWLNCAKNYNNNEYKHKRALQDYYNHELLIAKNIYVHFLSALKNII
jgi:hypothetical protein